MNKDNFVILDIEVNVEENTPFELHFNVIQLGATKITNGDYDNYDTFNSYIKPQDNQGASMGELTEFIKKLTKIEQKTIDEEGVSFTDAWNKFLVFCAPYFEFFASWGEYDWNILKKNCDYFGLPFPFKYHVNIKDYYRMIYSNKSVKLGMGVPSALKFFGLTYNEEGHHNGLEDAKMITMIAKAMAEKDFYTFKKSLYEFNMGNILTSCVSDKSRGFLVNPIMVKEYNDLEKRRQELNYVMFPTLC